MEEERTELDKLASRREKAQKRLENYMTDYYETTHKKVNQVFKDEAGDLKMAWLHAPHYMAPLMPTREEPGVVYIGYRRLLMDSPKEINADGIIKLVKRYAEALDPVLYMNMRAYTFALAQEIERKKSDPHYSRLDGLRDASRMLRQDHQAEFLRMLYAMQHVEEFKHPFDKSVSKSIDKIKSVMLPNQVNAPFGVLSMKQRNEMAHIFNKKIPEAKYRPRERNGRGGRSTRGEQNRYKPYDRDFRENRDRNQRDQSDRSTREDTASRGRSRRRSRGGRGRGRGQNQQPTQRNPSYKEEPTKVSDKKPTKNAIWQHSDVDREAVIETFRIHE